MIPGLFTHRDSEIRRANEPKFIGAVLGAIAKPVIGALAGKAADKIFGGGSEGGVVSQQGSNYTPEQLELLKKGIDITSQQLSNNPTIDYSKLEGYDQYRDSLMNWNTQAPDRINEIFKQPIVNSPYTGDLVQKLYSDVLRPDFYENTVPQMRSEWAGPGYWGDARARGMTDAFTDFERGYTTDYLGAEEKRLMNDYGVTQGYDSQRRQALLNAFAQEPANYASLLNLSAKGAQPAPSPWFDTMNSLLGHQPVNTAYGVQQPTMGFGDYAAQGAGTYLGQKIPGMIDNIMGKWGGGGGSNYAGAPPASQPANAWFDGYDWIS